MILCFLFIPVSKVGYCLAYFCYGNNVCKYVQRYWLTTFLFVALQHSILVLKRKPQKMSSIYDRLISS